MTTNFRTAVLLGLAVLVAVMWGLTFASERLEHVASGIAALEPRRFETLKPTRPAFGRAPTPTAPSSRISPPDPVEAPG